MRGRLFNILNKIYFLILKVTKYDLYFAVKVYILFLILILFGTWLGRNFIIPGPTAHLDHSWFNAFTIWDYGWYLNIAQHGYSYSSSVHAQQNVAFFPLYPLIEKLTNIITHSWSSKSTILPSIMIGFFAVYFFSKLAKEFFEDETSRIITYVFAFYPGAIFNMTGYPTSLLNLGAILTFYLILKNKFLFSALAAGLTTMAGPLAAVLSIPVALSKFSLNMINLRKYPREFAKVVSLFLISLWGIILLIIYDGIHLKNFTALFDAQRYWEISPPLSFWNNLWDFITLHVIFGSRFPLGSFVHSLKPLMSNSDLIGSEIGFVLVINMLMFFLFLFLTLGAFFIKKIPKTYALYSLILLAVFLWEVTKQGTFQSYVRLLYIDIPFFIFLGYLYERNKDIVRGVLSIFILLLFVFTLFTVSGYWMI